MTDDTSTELSHLNGPKLKTKRTSKACFYCRKSHVSCGEDRPCKRCKQRGMEHMCFDEAPKKRGRKLQPPPEDLINQPPSASCLQHARHGPSFPEHLEKNFEVVDHYEVEKELALNSYLGPTVDEFSIKYLGLDFLNMEPTAMTEHFKAKMSTFSDKVELGEILPRMEELVHKVSTIRASLSNEVIYSIAQEFTSQLKTWKDMFKPVAVPTLIFGRGGVIHFVNDAYIRLTGFTMVLPTDFGSSALAETVSPDAAKTFFLSLMPSIHEKITNSLMVPAGLRSFHPSTTEFPNYIQGTIAITIKRDPFGIPLLLLANFLPQLN